MVTFPNLKKITPLYFLLPNVKLIMPGLKGTSCHPWEARGAVNNGAITRQFLGNKNPALVLITAGDIHHLGVMRPWHARPAGQHRIHSPYFGGVSRGKKFHVANVYSLEEEETRAGSRL